MLNHKINGFVRVPGMVDTLKNVDMPIKFDTENKKSFQTLQKTVNQIEEDQIYFNRLKEDHKKRPIPMDNVGVNRITENTTQFFNKQNAGLTKSQINFKQNQNVPYTMKPNHQFYEPYLDLPNTKVHFQTLQRKNYQQMTPIETEMGMGKSNLECRNISYRNK